MGFFGKIKQWMGIGGVKLQVQPSSPDMPVNGGSISGVVQIESKSDQLITRLTVKIIEEMSEGRGNEKTRKEFTLGTAIVASDVPVKAGEVQNVNFSVPYNASKSMADRLASKGGALGALGKIGKFAAAEKTRYQVHAHAAVKGTAVGSNAKADLQPVA